MVGTKAISRKALEGIVRETIKKDPRKTSALWNSPDIEVVVDSHKKFLVSVAEQGGRISSHALTAILMTYFESPKEDLHKFSKKMQEVISYCKLKKKCIKTGSKTSAVLMDVINAFPKGVSTDDLESSPAEGSHANESQITCCSSSDDEGPELIDIDADEGAESAQQQTANAMLQKAMAMFTSSTAPPKQQKRSSSDASPVPAQKKSALGDSPMSVSSEAEVKQVICNQYN